MVNGRVYLATLLATLVVLLLGGMNGLGRLDLALYDWANRHLANASSTDIVLVTIDDPSLQEIGRWPWPRSVLAELIDRVSAGGPAAIGVDVLFSELSAEATEDQRLVDAIRNSGKVVLPMFSAADRDGHIQAMTPALPFVRAAAAVGHVLVEADQDGTVRSAFLREGWSDQSWEHFALALLRVSGQAPTSLPGVRAPTPPLMTELWHRDYWVHIPFRADPSYRRISVADVLQGRIKPDFWLGKTVLIGASATGLGDAYPTPVSGDTRYMPGVEISATLLDTLRSEWHWQQMPAWLSAVLTLLITGLALPLIAKSRPWRGLLFMIGAVALMVGLMLLLLKEVGLIWPPMAAMLSVLGAYFIWNARRLEFAFQYLLKELKLIRKLLPEADPAAPRKSSSLDVVDQHILKLTDASERLRALHQVIRSVMEGLPDAAMLVDSHDRILQMNERAKNLIVGMGQTVPDNHQPAMRWSEVFTTVTLLNGESLASYWTAQTQQGLSTFETEVAYPGGQQLLLKAAVCDSDPMLEDAYIVSLVDISSLRAAEKERDEALRFLSHDLRSPQASILSLVDMLRSPKHELDLPSSLSRISAYASRTIALAEGFVEQARLSSQPLRWHPCELSELVDVAIDECWAQASAKRIRLRLVGDLSPQWSVAAGDLLLRSLVNLINNAIKYSPSDTHVEMRIVKHKQGWGISIQDQGRGMDASDLARLRQFEAFTRIEARDGETEESGFGLGLRFVDMVARRHAGFLDIDSTLNKGSCFTLNIWVHQPEPVLESESPFYNDDA